MKSDKIKVSRSCFLDFVAQNKRRERTSEKVDKTWMWIKAGS
jgi:hypothetical protein